ncbi:hypothetical protein LINPERHAP1_LOCUS19269 [Linum perenne]
MLSVTFWKGVNLCLKVCEPLVKVLRIVDGDVKPSIGFVYGKLVTVKREIQESLQRLHDYCQQEDKWKAWCSISFDCIFVESTL